MLEVSYEKVKKYRQKIISSIENDPFQIHHLNNITVDNLYQKWRFVSSYNYHGADNIEYIYLKAQEQQIPCAMSDELLGALIAKHSAKTLIGEVQAFGAFVKYEQIKNYQKLPAHIQELPQIKELIKARCLAEKIIGIAN